MLSKKKLAKLEKMLRELERRYAKELESLASSLERSEGGGEGSLPTYTYHIADVGTDVAQREEQSIVTTTVYNILRDIELALTKIREGGYGICEKCGKDISEDRLEAMPYARLCLECKREEER